MASAPGSGQLQCLTRNYHPLPEANGHGASAHFRNRERRLAHDLMWSNWRLVAYKFRSCSTHLVVTPLLGSQRTRRRAICEMWAP